MIYFVVLVQIKPIKNDYTLQKKFSFIKNFTNEQESNKLQINNNS
jgi:hypothetical protein